MLDPKRLRSEPEQVREALLRRGYDFDIQGYQKLEASRQQLQVDSEQLQAQRNSLSREIGKLRGEDKPTDELMRQVSEVGEKLDHAKHELDEVGQHLQNIHLEMPNIPDKEVPDGRSEADNQELRRWGEPVQHDFATRDHVAVGEPLGLDLATAAKVSGARFSFLWGDLALLHRALAQFMLNTHTRQHGYTEVHAPCLVSGSALQGTGQLPKFASDLFRLEGDQDLYLISTAEVPLTNAVADSILERELPLRMVAHTSCFRSEAGSYGRDTRGIIRQHLFEKVELVQIVTPEQSDAALEELTTHAENILKALELPYRVVSLCAGDLGFGAARTYDLEVWLPSEKAYREISSCSNTRCFQARRLKARYRHKASEKPQLVHTLNGSGLAIGRTLVAILENFQQEDGSLIVPPPLRDYCGGLEVITPAQD